VTKPQLINHVRGTVKSVGERWPACAAEGFPRHIPAQLPGALRDLLTPVLELIAQLTHTIRAYDGVVAQVATASRAVTDVLRQVRGVGALTAIAYHATLEDPQRFRHSRQVGAYLGLCPKQNQSGERDPELRITKAGDELLRRLLVSSAHYILGPFGPDTALRRWGLRLAQGGKRAKRRAVVAVARKLAVLLHRLWVTGARYEPLRGVTA
jgi:transposase